jgi:nitroreductase/NAD-dependent dihydropyrimidine dehydrogenase PreA subunit
MLKPEGRPEVSVDACVRCGKCIAACSLDVLEMGERGPEATGEAPCFRCGHCVAVCPTGAIYHPGMKAEHFRELLPQGEGVTSALLFDLLRKRRSVRNYTDEQVTEEEIMQLIEAAVQAPSGLNAQSWCFTIIQDQEHLAHIRRRIRAIYRFLLKMLDSRVSKFMLRLQVGQEAVDVLEEARPLLEGIVDLQKTGTDRLFWGAPTLVVVHSPEEDPTGVESAHYAVANFMLMATTMGLGTCLIGFLTAVAEHDARVRELIGVPEDHSLDAALVVGHPDVQYLRSVDKRAAQINFI